MKILRLKFGRNHISRDICANTYSNVIDGKILSGKIDLKHEHQFQICSKMHGLSKGKAQHYIIAWQESNCNPEILVQAGRSRRHLVLIKIYEYVDFKLRHE